ncbi:MAG TPA: antibiotic biosynthesis monooxygenase [Roseateles sp.]|nr:antibiotic biosynthesis monooxygenase [Roseateles sp.]
MQEAMHSVSPPAAPSRPRSGPRIAARTAGPVFRADKFVVPVDMLDDFMAQIQRVDRIVAALPGCLRHLVLVQLDGQGRNDDAVEVMTIVEWSDAQALRAAKEQMQRRYASAGFHPAAFMQALGVKADLGSYGLAI